ncbi:hypothetical protein [Bradyrhizobium sp. BR13661]|jgi:hypothetical protein|uniref:hypothetical protein n=1 Tax=Bradyrhizobium sp. BR13661 TaxID=2940622 RepID=UPI00247729D8|nr:hypothetical protein [Bradyrhizobium sp. BR13661]MDH6262979.1 hypothetical protein [Bradyrhizobium sp. BR13661]
MAVFFGVLCALAVTWSIVKYFGVQSVVSDTLPLQFRDGLNSRYAIPIYALEPSTPLAVQAEYMKSLAGGCVAVPSFALACFFAGQMQAALLGTLGATVVVISTVKSWMTYRDNCRRQILPADTNEA